jgi:transcriptional regulator with XRE-family HTH domain
MATANALDPVEITAKIARLVEERGWNQEDFARIASLNRHTARTILQSQGRKLRNATVQACARALGLTVSELRTLPLERLLPRMRGQTAPEGNDRFQALLDQVTQPELTAWLTRNEDRARRLTPSEADELLNMQGPSGPLVALGVERVIEHLERKRELLKKVQAVAGTEYLNLLEQFVALLYDKTQPNPSY